MVSPRRKRLADCINVSWHMHGHLVHGLLYFHAYSKLPCTVQQFATLLGLALFLVPLPYVHDTWYPNGNNKSPILVYILINFTFHVWLRSWMLISLLEHRACVHENNSTRKYRPTKFTSSQSMKIYTTKFSTRTVIVMNIYVSARGFFEGKLAIGQCFHKRN